MRRWKGGRPTIPATAIVCPYLPCEHAGNYSSDGRSCGPVKHHADDPGSSVGGSRAGIVGCGGVVDAAACDAATCIVAFAGGGSGRFTSRRRNPSASVDGLHRSSGQCDGYRRCHCCCRSSSRTDRQLQRYWRNVCIDTAIRGGCAASSGPASSATAATTHATSGDGCGSGARDGDKASATHGTCGARHGELQGEPVHYYGDSPWRHSCARESCDGRTGGWGGSGCCFVNGTPRHWRLQRKPLDQRAAT